MNGYKMFLMVLFVKVNLFGSNLKELAGGDNFICEYGFNELNFSQNSDVKCRQNENDEFEIGSKVLFGVDKGRCLDTSASRPVILMNDAQLRKYGIEKRPGYEYVANFKHMGKFYFAEIPINSVERQIIQNELFANNILEEYVGGHLQTRMIFSEPVVLRPQPSKNGKKTFIKEIIMSAESIRPVVKTKKDDGSISYGPERYSSIGKGTNKTSYRNAYVMTSSEEKLAIEAQRKDHHKFEQYEIKESKAFMKEFFYKWVKTSTFSLNGGVYDSKAELGNSVIANFLQPSTNSRKLNGRITFDIETIKKNNYKGSQCTSSQWKIYDMVTKVRKRSAPNNAIDDSLPRQIKKALIRRGINFEQIEDFKEHPFYKKLVN